MASVYFGFTQDLILVLEVFHLMLAQMFFIWKNIFENLLNSPIAFGMIFSTFNKSLLPWPMCKSSSTNLSPPSDHDVPQIQQVEPLHIFISIYFLSKTISAFYSSSWRFTKELPFLFWFLPRKPISHPSPLNPQPRSMKIHWSPVQNFQTILAASLDQICQIWWNSFKSLSKILRKIRQPLGALRGHLTKSQLQEKFSSC